MKHFFGSLRRRVPGFMLAGVLILLSAASAHAQGGATVRAIDVQYSGPANVSRERILSQMRTAVGQPYSDTTVEQDIRTLYGTGQIQNVRIFGQPAGDGVKVIVVVQTRAIVSEIAIEGAERISPKKLRKQIELKIGAYVNEDKLAEARQKIVDTYQARGFTDVDVNVRVDNATKPGTARVVYTVKEGVRGAVSAIRFEGNTAFSDRVLRKRMKTKGKTPISFLDKSGRLDESQFRQDVEAVREWYQNHGYMDVDVKDVLTERGNGRTNITIAISEGQKYHVGKITIRGEKVTTDAKIRALLKMREGNVYSPKALHDDAKAVADAYGTGGYVDLNIIPQSEPAGPGRLDVVYNVEEGNRAFVQRINIVGNTRTKDKVVRREVLIVPGDVYNTVRVDTSKKRLENLGYFSKVETYPEETGVAGRKDLTIEVQEKRTGALNFGAGFSTIDSLVGFIELTQGNFDLLSWPNFTGGGQKFRARIQYGTRRKDFTIGLTEPYFLDRVLSFGGEAFFHEADYLSSVYDQRDYGFALEARKPLGRFLSLSLGYRLEATEIFNLAVGISPQILAETQSRLKSEISTTLVFDTRDNPFLTRRGQRITLTPYIAGGFLGGNTQIYGFDLEASQYFKLPWDLIALFNTEIAGVNQWGSGDQVPIFDRLFLGGSNNLRGFNYRDVGPKDKNGEPLGGRTLARATVEITYPIIEHIRGAVFYDIGLLGDAAWDPAAGRIASDVGIGVRLDLPVGPLRIDYAIPLKKDGNDGSGKFNFNVGYQF
ncbi:MAG: outer membrane protein assembly factor BamA [Chthoniobacterales bacterium]|nr:outer membrane protein assembly factor BamA [Chthoniobacterales bacterium]